MCYVVGGYLEFRVGEWLDEYVGERRFFWWWIGWILCGRIWCYNWVSGYDYSFDMR